MGKNSIIVNDPYIFLKLILSVLNKRKLSAFLNKEIISDLVFDSHGEEEFYHCQ